MKKNLILLIIAVTIVLFDSCYYDKEELVYPKDNCDTANMTYTKDIQSIIVTNCSGCHTGTVTSGINFSNYAALKLRADNGVLLERITTTNITRLMPQGGPRLPDCTINKIKAWINQKAPN